MSLYGGPQKTPEQEARSRAFQSVASLGRMLFKDVSVGAALLIIALLAWTYLPIEEWVQSHVDANRAIEEQFKQKTLHDAAWQAVATDAKNAQKDRDLQYIKQSLEEERYKKALADKTIAAATGG